jgi:hypothetical protein
MIGSELKAYRTLEVFKPGLQRAGVVVRFAGNSLTWNLTGTGGELLEAVVNEKTSACQKVKPIVECLSLSTGEPRARIGYNNPNPFTLVVPIGIDNSIQAAPIDRGQPTEFYPGANIAVGHIPAAGLESDGLWSLNGLSQPINSSLPRCTGECSEVNLQTIKSNLDRIAVDMSKLVRRAAAILREFKHNAAKGSLKDEILRRSKIDELRSRKKADEYVETAHRLLLKFPQVTQVCPEKPNCIHEDNYGTIMALRQLYAQTRNTVMRITARTYFVTTGATRRNKLIVRTMKALERHGNAELDKLPRVASACGAGS